MMGWYFFALAVALALAPLQLVAAVFGPVGLAWFVLQLVAGHRQSLDEFRRDGR